MSQNKLNDNKLNGDFSVTETPSVVRIEPSAKCTLRCIHCPTGTRNDVERGVMSDDVFGRIVEEIQAQGGVRVVVLYHGGEPFVHKKMVTMVKTLKNIGIPFVKTVTNGTLLNDELSEAILESGLDSIEFSLDGLTPEENNEIRRGADFFKISAAIKRFLALRRFHTAEKLSVFIANTQISTERDLLAGTEIAVPAYLKETFQDFLGEIDFKVTHMIKWPGFDCGEEYKVIKEKSSLEKAKNRCDHVLDTTTIRWNGDLVPCCYDLASDYVLGNIMENSLPELWNNERYRSIRKSIKEREHILLCSDCHEIQPQLLVVRK